MINIRVSSHRSFIGSLKCLYITIVVQFILSKAHFHIETVTSVHTLHSPSHLVGVQSQFSTSQLQLVIVSAFG